MMVFKLSKEALLRAEPTELVGLIRQMVSQGITQFEFLDDEQVELSAADFDIRWHEQPH